MVHWGEDLFPTQNQELSELVDQFVDLFFIEPRLRHLVHHNILTHSDIQVIRQRPYQALKAHHHAINAEWTAC